MHQSFSGSGCGEHWLFMGIRNNRLLAGPSHLCLSVISSIGHSHPLVIYGGSTWPGLYRREDLTSGVPDPERPGSDPLLRAGLMVGWKGRWHL